MGIKHFFGWLRNNFDKDLKYLQSYETVPDRHGIIIDELLIDMNGLFHTAAQKVYRYGNHKPPKRLLPLNRPGLSQEEKNARVKAREEQMYHEICSNIELLINKVRPTYRIVLCTDGPAPMSKQNQQRQRRFRNSSESSDKDIFDSNCLTPGTEIMDRLSKYIESYILSQISQNPFWRKLEIIFSNEKVPGEGEHKCIQYLRRYCYSSITYCIVGNDADLLMLSLGTHLPNFYILREDSFYTHGNNFFLIDVGSIYISLGKRLNWSQEKFNLRNGIIDFIFLCFMTGNDFLPHIPSVEIIEDGIEIVLSIYQDVCSEFEIHLVQEYSNNGIVFNKKVLKQILTEIGNLEKDCFESKLNKKECYFPDPLLNKSSIQLADGKISVDITEYNSKYISKTFGKNQRNIKNGCHRYLEGLRWVINYYLKGVPDWKWLYPYHYAPPASLLVEYIQNYQDINYEKLEFNCPLLPFQQLLSVLPPQSAHLLPHPLSELLKDKSSSLAQYCPDEVKIDLAGKKQEWEAVVLVPVIDYKVVLEEYNKNINKVPRKYSSRNYFGNTYLYKSVSDKPKSEIFFL